MDGIILSSKWIRWIIEMTVEIESIEWLKDSNTFKIPPKIGYASGMAKT
jgi:hypothetical protein